MKLFVVPGNNGVFKPTVVDAGRVVGIWKRTVTKSKVKVEAIPFAEFSATGKPERAFLAAFPLIILAVIVVFSHNEPSVEPH